MDDAVRDCLCDVIARYGVAITREPQRLEALLADLCPGRPAGVFLVVTALKNGAAEELLRPGSAVPVGTVAAQLVQRLGRLGLSEEAARWSVESWIAALPGLPPLAAPAGPAPAAPPPAAPRMRAVHVLPHPAAVQHVSFRPDGQILVTRASDNAARGWSVTSGDERYAVDHDVHVRDLTFSPDSFWLAAAGNDGIVRVVDANDGTELSRYTPRTRVSCLSFSPDGSRLAAATVGGIVWLGDMTGRTSELACGNEPVLGMAFRPDGAWLATMSGRKGDARVQIWVVRTGNERSRFHVPSSEKSAHAHRIAFSPDGDWLVAILYGNAVIRHTLTWDGQVVFDCDPWGFDWAPDSESWAVTEGDGALVVPAGSAGARRQIRHGAVEHGQVHSVAFSPDGRWLATGSEDTTARIWDVSTSQELARVRHFDTVSSVAFSPDGTLLATASRDATVRLWQL